jgi:hypothetical protein
MGGVNQQFKFISRRIKLITTALVAVSIINTTTQCSLGYELGCRRCKDDSRSADAINIS